MSDRSGNGGNSFGTMLIWISRAADNSPAMRSFAAVVAVRSATYRRNSQRICSNAFASRLTSLQDSIAGMGVSKSPLASRCETPASRRSGREIDHAMANAGINSSASPAAPTNIIIRLSRTIPASTSFSGLSTPRGHPVDGTVW